MALRIVTFENTKNNVSEVLESLYPNKLDNVSQNSCCSLDNKQDQGGVTGKGDIPYQGATIGNCVLPVSAEAIDKVKPNREVNSIASSEADSSQGSSADNKAQCMQSACSLHKHADRHTIISGFVNVLNQIHGEQLHGKKSANKEECLPLALKDQNKQECQDLGNIECDSTKESDERGNLDKFDVDNSHHPSDSVQTFKSGVNTSRSDLDMAGNSASFNVSEGGTKIGENCKEQSAFSNFLQSDCSGCDLDCPCNPSTCNSYAFTSPGSVLNNNNLTSSVYKFYIETSDGPHELPDLTNEFDMFDGSLPLTVKTCNHSTLKQVFKINKNNPNTSSNPFLEETLGSRMLPALAVQQVTLDLEQCINELILAHEGLRHSYKSLKDYDVQVVGVCPDSGEVITMARLLVYTRTKQPCASFGLPVSPRFVIMMFTLFTFFVCLYVFPVSCYCARKENCTKMDAGSTLATNALNAFAFFKRAPKTHTVIVPCYYTCMASSVIGKDKRNSAP